MYFMSLVKSLKWIVQSPNTLRSATPLVPLELSQNVKVSFWSITKYTRIILFNFSAFFVFFEFELEYIKLGEKKSFLISQLNNIYLRTDDDHRACYTSFWLWVDVCTKLTREIIIMLNFNRMINLMYLKEPQ